RPAVSHHRKRALRYRCLPAFADFASPQLAAPRRQCLTDFVPAHTFGAPKAQRVPRTRQVTITLSSRRHDLLIPAERPNAATGHDDHHGTEPSHETNVPAPPGAPTGKSHRLERVSVQHSSHCPTRSLGS